jgi:DNA-binding NarL/FixJ family response regulator
MDLRQTKITAQSGLSNLTEVAPTSTEGIAVGGIVVIERRALTRECLVRGFESASDAEVIAFESVESWIKVCDQVPARVIVLCRSESAAEADLGNVLSLLSNASGAPVVLLTDCEDPDHVIDALEMGVRGCLTTGAPLEIAIEALRFVQAGGTYVPASSLIAARRKAETVAVTKQNDDGIFTARQAAVVEALRRGKANKIIAYELNMRESTVKVHVRNIMKKLKARNRTEVAFLTNNGLGAGLRE